MKCLIFSDSHGADLYINKALLLHKDAEVVFFLGDGISSVRAIAESDSGRAWIMVKGNCDFSSFLSNGEEKKTEEITLLGKKIIATHGDAYFVKNTLENLKNLARVRLADIVLFGHTHVPYTEYVSEDRPFYLFNPGSISRPSYSYGILTLKENVVFFSHGEF